MKIVNKISYNTLDKPSYHLFLISLNFRKKRNKDNFLSFLKKNNILGQSHYIPIYKHKIFRKKIDLSNYKGSEYYYKNTVSLPIFYKLSFEQQKKIIEKIRFYNQEYL